MKVMLISRFNYKQLIFIDNAISVRIEIDVRGNDSWVIETAEGNRLFMCQNWFVYLHYDQK